MWILLMFGCGDDTVPAEVELQQSQIELLQQQNALLQDQIDQLEQKLTTLQTDWNDANVTDRLDSLEDTQDTQQDDITLLLSVMNDHDLALREAENDIDSVQHHARIVRLEWIRHRILGEL